MNMYDFPDFFRMEIGNYVDMFVKWLMRDFGEVFDAISDGILFFLLNVEKFLMWLPWWLVLLVIFLTAWKINNYRAGILYATIVFLIGTFGFGIL